MKLSEKTKTIIFQISALLILFAAILYAFEPTIAKYTMIFGVIGFAFISFTSPYPGKSLRGKRLYNMQVFAVLLMAVSAYLMYSDMREWVVPMLMAAILTLYSSYMTAKVYKEEEEEKEDEK